VALELVVGEVIEGSPSGVDLEAEVVVVGAGACGLTAALRARACGREVIVLERDASPSGSTSLSSGFVPAPGTRFQRKIGVTDDTPDRLFVDLMDKSLGASNARLARLASNAIGPAIEWLADVGGLAWMVLDDFLYPGHSRHRMHALPEMSGVALEARLLGAAEAAAIPIVTEAQAVRLFKGADNRIEAVEVLRPDEATETLRCGALILACNGFAGNPELVRENIPEIAAGPYYGHAGNTGDAVLWGRALGAELKHLSGYQGHGSLAHPHRILITWAVMMEGGIQVNTEGRRFANEHRGYSEQATAVLAQPGGVAWNIYDRERHEFALCFPDYREAIAASAIRSAGTVEALAEVTELPVLALAETLADVMAFQGGARVDPLQRDFTGKPPLAAPYYAVKVTGALFHTQGGLMIDQQARVLSCAGDPFPNLFAGGGAACGVSGPHVGGYLSGNGLLSALAFGYLAGGNA
jgi:fumarate reductase flavoprotein subunit